MPSPIGHALAGVAIAWTMRGRSDWKVTALCAAFACLPDIDLLYLPLHRTATHSIPMAVLLTIIAVTVTGRVNLTRQKGKTAKWQKGGSAQGQEGGSTPFCLLALLPSCLTGLAIGLAWSSHVLLDWLGADASVPQGIQILWPFSDRWYFSGWDLFPGTERRRPFGARALALNLRAALQEAAIMGSIVLAVWLVRRQHDERRDHRDQ